MPVTMSLPGKSYIPSLNGLRALSILFVFICHFQISPNSPISSLRPPWTFFADGNLGVNIFFVISGYLITMLLMKEKELSKTVSLKNFYTRRALRIFPAYYFLFFCYFILQLFKIMHLQRISWVTSLTYTKYFYETDWPTHHLWSLSVEEHFYLLWPLLFKLRKNTKYSFLFIVFLTVPILRVANIYNKMEWMNIFSLFQRVDAIVAGCLLALHYEKISVYVHRVIQKSRLFFILPLLVLFFLYLLAGISNLPPVLRILLTAIGGTEGTIANMAIVFLIVSSINYKTRCYNFLNLRFISFVGKLSYSIYLWQQIFFYAKLKKIAGISFNTFPVNVCGIIIMALFSYYVIEKPFLKIKRRYEMA